MSNTKKSKHSINTKIVDNFYHRSREVYVFTNRFWLVVQRARAATTGVVIPGCRRHVWRYAPRGVLTSELSEAHCYLSKMYFIIDLNFLFFPELKEARVIFHRRNYNEPESRGSGWGRVLGGRQRQLACWATLLATFHLHLADRCLFFSYWYSQMRVASTNTCLEAHPLPLCSVFMSGWPSTVRGGWTPWML